MKSELDNHTRKGGLFINFTPLKTFIIIVFDSAMSLVSIGQMKNFHVFDFIKYLVRNLIKILKTE